MITITEIFTVLSLELSASNLSILIQTCKGIFRLSGKVTGLNISRYTDKGGSYRSIQRLFSENIDWFKLRIKLFESYLFSKDDTYAIAADECVEGKSGKSTFGIDKFFSSISSKVIPSISFLHFSFLSVNNNDSYSICAEQIVKKEKVNSKNKLKKKKKKQGRPKGSKNKNKSIINYTQLLSLADKMLTDLNEKHDKLLNKMRLGHFVGDGAYGNNNWILMLEKHNLKLVSKLHYNSALYFKYTGAYSGIGQPRKYGEKIDIENINSSFLIKTIDDKNKNYVDYIYQIQVLNKNFRDKLNVVIIIRENRKTGKKGNVILFSNNTELSAQKIMDIYSLRFQIEFNFRDAKQFFGLSDFKNIKETQVKNAINLSLFMTLLSKILLIKYRDFFKNNKLSINDLKSLFRAAMYISKILKIDKNNALTIFNSDTYMNKILSIGLINGKLVA
ncbi:MAG: transposase [Flavobacteriaceae bacterium]|nr:transposase [Flavobacteriaceae bacterium]